MKQKYSNNILKKPTPKSEIVYEEIAVKVPKLIMDFSASANKKPKGPH